MEIELRVRGLYNTGDPDSLLTVPVQEMEVNLQGIVENKKSGFSKDSDSRDRELLRDSHYPKHVEVRNWRQWSAVSPEELTDIANNLNVDLVTPEMLGANISLEGITNFTTLPRGTVFRFPSEAMLMVEEENNPCIGPGEEIHKVYPQVKPNLFQKSAIHKRGLVGVVQRAGILKVDDVVNVKVYEPKIYSIPPCKQ